MKFENCNKHQLSAEVNQLLSEMRAGLFIVTPIRAKAMSDFINTWYGKVYILFWLSVPVVALIWLAYDR